ncbi:DNA-directed RNA polymerase subunit beta [Frankliniella fusca]|uniref:DNA-directed RNA polymerase subunit beta n=1 Tax=Frankliniella fusca TaxID=407009 RepID=A0AAE1HW20_9NEOP|nr:DNA-directed RNA polymerase subunit beta [Frankliniella fusca]
MRKKSHLSNPPKRRKPKTASNGFPSRSNSFDSASRDSSLHQDDDTDSLTDNQDTGIHRNFLTGAYDAFNHYLFNDPIQAIEASAENLTLNDSLPLTDQLKRAIRQPSFDSIEGLNWQPTEIHNFIGIYPECCVEEEDLTRIKKELDMEHIGKSSSWDEKSYWQDDIPIKKEVDSSNLDGFSEESGPQRKAFSTDGKLHSIKVLPTGEVVPTGKQSSDNLQSGCLTNAHEQEPSKYSRKSRVKSRESNDSRDLGRNKHKTIEIKRENPATKYEVTGHECEKCGTVLKTAFKMREHLERHKELERQRKHAGQLPSKEQLVKEVPVLVNLALKAIMDEEASSALEHRVEAYARRLYFNSFPLWREISKELVHEVWQYVTLTELTILPAVDWDHFVWSRSMWLTSGGRRESFVLNLLFLYPDDSEVVELFFYKFFMKLNEAVFKFSMRCLGSSDVISETFCAEADLRFDPGQEELHTLCSLVLRTYIKRASQNKTVKGWNAIYKSMKRNFVENRETGQPPKSADLKQWAMEDSNQLITTKRAFRFFSLVEAVIQNINKVNDKVHNKVDGPIALHKMVLRAVYLRQDIIRAWDKLVATSHFEEMDSLYVLEMLVKSFAFFSGCATARKQKQKAMEEEEDEED